MNAAMNKTALNLTMIATAILASGCVSPQLTNSAKADIEQARVAADAGLAKARPTTTSKETFEKSQEVDAPYIVGKSIPLARSVALPAPLRKEVQTLVKFSDPWVSLSSAAERIMLATGMLVTIAPDVYLDSAALQRKNGAGAGGGTATPAFAAMPVGMAPAEQQVSVPLPLPTPLGKGASLPMSSGTVGKTPRPPESANGFDFPRVNAPLAQILDIIATKLSIKWRYEEATNRIHFYRLVTKTWETPFRATKASYRSALQNEQAMSTNDKAVQQRSSQAPVDDELSGLNELNTMRDNLESVMTRSGTVFANPATGGITLTDTAEAVEAANTIVRDAIRTLSRTVQLRVQTIKVTSTDEGQIGVDMSAAISRALKNLPDFKIGTTSPATLTTANSGSLGLHVYSGSAAGSEAIINALKAVGDVKTSTEIPLATRNRRGVFYNVRKTFSYVASTTPAAAVTGGTGGTPGITTAQDVVGLKLFLVPEVSSRDLVTLSMSLDQSTLQSLDTFSSGSGATLQSVQLPNIEGEGSSQVVPIRNGQTIVLTGFDSRSDELDKRTLGDYVPLIAGGSKKVSKTRSTTIVLVTAEVADGVTD